MSTPTSPTHLERKHIIQGQGRWQHKVDRTGQLEAVKRSLFLLAYRILGIRADAEDVVQEAYLRWLNASDDEIRMPRS